MASLIYPSPPAICDQRRNKLSEQLIDILKLKYMRVNFLSPAALLITLNCFSQITVQKKQAEQVKAGSTVPTNPTVQQNTAIKTVTATNNILSSPSNKKTDSSKANFTEASFSITTARSYNEDPGTNKAADTHWSCVLFDQNGRQIASFNDDSNNDEYVSGSQTPVLKMHVDNNAAFEDFSKGGRLHISITPNGNDTWEISEFDLNLDFTGPTFTSKLKWNAIRLTQDSKDIDLHFNQQSNSTPQYDLKANKKS